MLAFVREKIAEYRLAEKDNKLLEGALSGADVAGGIKPLPR